MIAQLTDCLAATSCPRQGRLRLAIPCCILVRGKRQGPAMPITEKTSHRLSVFVGTARFLKVNPVAATMTAKHVDQVSAGQQRNRFIAGKRIGVWAVVARRD